MTFGAANPSSSDPTSSTYNPTTKRPIASPAAAKNAGPRVADLPWFPPLVQVVAVAEWRAEHSELKSYAFGGLPLEIALNKSTVIVGAFDSEGFSRKVCAVHHPREASPTPRCRNRPQPAIRVRLMPVSTRGRECADPGSTVGRGGRRRLASNTLFTS
jgi:hypothetical protein